MIHPMVALIVASAMGFVIGVAALRGPLKDYVPTCTSTTSGFCYKRVQ